MHTLNNIMRLSIQSGIEVHSECTTYEHIKKLHQYLPFKNEYVSEFESRLRLNTAESERSWTSTYWLKGNTSLAMMLEEMYMNGENKIVGTEDRILCDIRGSIAPKRLKG